MSGTLPEQARTQLLDLEDGVPWNAVKATWRARRPGWRRSLKGADSVAAVAQLLDEFRQHFANDGATMTVRARCCCRCLLLIDISAACAAVQRQILLPCHILLNPKSPLLTLS
jgi:hypothetical protein